MTRCHFHIEIYAPKGLSGIESFLSDCQFPVEPHVSGFNGQVILRYVGADDADFAMDPSSSEVMNASGSLDTDWAHRREVLTIQGAVHEDLDGLTVKSLSWVPMVESLQVKLSFRGEAMAIFTDWEMCPFLCGDGATSATLVDTVADHMGRCHMKGPVTVIRTRWKYSRRR